MEGGLFLEVEGVHGGLDGHEAAVQAHQGAGLHPTCLVDAQLADVVGPGEAMPLGGQQHRVAAGGAGDSFSCQLDRPPDGMQTPLSRRSLHPPLVPQACPLNPARALGS
uniref:Uncharacterized protein n=1 Tax=Naja naja TaxID=35670 RepID=A0A8C6VHP2_NAJNA